MDTAVFIARFLGPYYLVGAAGMLFNRKFFQKVMEDFTKNSVLILYGGLFAFVVGLVILINHNTWSADWSVIITIFGWAALLKGIWLIVFPGSVEKFMQVYLRNKSFLTIHALLALALGIFFSVKGYLG